MNEQYLEMLKNQDWERIVLQLTSYCQHLFKRNDVKQTITQAKSIEDVVSQAINLVLSGERKWEYERGDLLNFLKFSVVRSLRSNMYSSSENSISVFLDDFYAYDSQHEINDGLIEIPQSLAVDEIIISEQEAIFLLAQANSILQHLGNEKITLIFNCLTEEITKPQEIEELTGIPAREVSELKRQLKKILWGINNE